MLGSAGFSDGGAQQLQFDMTKYLVPVLAKHCDMLPRKQLLERYVYIYTRMYEYTVIPYITDCAHLCVKLGTKFAYFKRESSVSLFMYYRNSIPRSLPIFNVARSA